MHAIKLQFALVNNDDLKPIVNRGEQEMKGGGTSFRLVIDHASNATMLIRNKMSY